MRFPPFADLDQDQRRVYADAPTDGAMLVTGPPGTGKTIIAMHRALRLAQNDDRQVTVIMFNKVLARYTSNFENPHNIKVIHMHGWAPNWYKTAFGRPIPTIDKYRTPDWQMIKTIIRNCREQSILKKLSWGHLIIDEGQDFDSQMYSALMAVVRHKSLEGDDQPTLTVFADENQTITDKNSTIVELIEELNTDMDTQRLWRLDKNYRNSTEIAKFSRHFQVRNSSHVALPERETARLPVVFIRVDEPYDQIIDFTANQGSLEVGVVVFGSSADVRRTYKELNKKIQQKRVKCRIQGYVSRDPDGILDDHTKLQFDSPPSITVVHQKSSKGLEFDAVFLINVNALRTRDGDELDSFKELYVAASRARDYLFSIIRGELEQSFFPDSMRLLPDPTEGLCTYLDRDGQSLDEDALLLRVNWLDTAYHHQRQELMQEGLVSRLREIDVNELTKVLDELARKSFAYQGTATIIEDRVRAGTQEGLLDLVIELGPIQVKRALNLE